MNEFKLPQKIKTKILICYVNVIINIPENNNSYKKSGICTTKLIKNSEYINYICFTEHSAVVDGQHRHNGGIKFNSQEFCPQLRRTLARGFDRLCIVCTDSRGSIFKGRPRVYIS